MDEVGEITTRTFQRLKFLSQNEVSSEEKWKKKVLWKWDFIFRNHEASRMKLKRTSWQQFWHQFDCSIIITTKPSALVHLVYDAWKKKKERRKFNRANLASKREKEDKNKIKCYASNFCFWRKNILLEKVGIHFEFQIPENN